MTATIILLILGSGMGLGQQTGPQIDVREFGGCSGAVNEGAALQAALNAVPSTGGTVVISCMLGVGPPGVMLANKDNVTVRGLAAGNGIRSLASTTNLDATGFHPVLFLLRTCTTCVVRDLEFDGNDETVIPLGLDHCIQTVVQNNYIHNVGLVAGGAVVSAGGVDNQFVSNKVYDTASVGSDSTRGMWLGNDGAAAETNLYISQNDVRNAGGTGIVAQGYGATITGNNVQDTGGAGTKVVPALDSTAPTLIANNTFRHNFFHGIQLTPSKNMTIRNNVLDNNYDCGIYAWGGLTNSLIANNVFTNNHYGVPQHELWCGGIRMNMADTVVIDSNQFYDTRTGTARTQDHGVVITSEIAGGVKNIQISNNSIYNNLINGIAITAQNTSATVMGVSLSHNTSINNSNYGLFINEQQSGSPGSITNIVDSNNNWSPNAGGQMRVWASHPFTSDTKPPAIAITSPKRGQTVSGPVILAASASATIGVPTVDFLVDGIATGVRVIAPPFTVGWDSTTAGPGPHTITAVATDGSGNRTNSAAVSITVATPVLWRSRGDLGPANRRMAKKIVKLVGKGKLRGDSDKGESLRPRPE